MKYIVLNATKKKWRAVDALGVYCTVCKVKVKYDSGKNPLGIQRHMTKYVIDTLEACRVLLVAQFNQRFSNLDSSILWTTLLDPRFGLNSAHWKNDGEKEAAKKLLLLEVEHLALPEWQAFHSERCLPIEVSSISGEDDFDLDFNKPASDSLSTEA